MKSDHLPSHLGPESNLQPLHLRLRPDAAARRTARRTAHCGIVE